MGLQSIGGREELTPRGQKGAARLIFRKRQNQPTATEFMGSGAKTFRFKEVSGEMVVHSLLPLLRTRCAMVSKRRFSARQAYMVCGAAENCWSVVRGE
jgi:hypothetical protein